MKHITSKLLSLLLTLAMLLSMVPAAYAVDDDVSENGDTAAGTIVEVGTANALQNAIDAAENNTPTTIKLTDAILLQQAGGTGTDSRGPIILEEGKNITIDLNGKRINNYNFLSNQNVIELKSGASLTITGQSGDGVVNQYSGSTAILVNTGAQLTVATTGGRSVTGSAVGIKNYGNLTVNSATLIGGSGRVVIDNYGDATINNCTVAPEYDGDDSIVNHDGGMLAITGGSFERCTVENVTSVTGGTFGDITFASGTTVSGATINGVIDWSGNVPVFTNVTLGESASLADSKEDAGYVLYNGQIRMGSEINVVAKIGTNEYESLAAAIAAADAGDTIVLMDNVVVDNLTLSKTVTIKSDGTQYEIKGLKAIAGTGVTLENVYLNQTCTLDIGGTNTTLVNCTIGAKDLSYNDIAYGDYGTAFGYNQSDPNNSYSYMTRVTGTDVVLKGCGIDGTAKVNDYFPNMSLMQLWGATNVTLTNCTFNEGTAAIYYGAVNGEVKIDGCTFTKIQDFGVNVSEGTNTTVSIKDSKLVGWHSFGSTVKSVSFENCTLGRRADNDSGCSTVATYTNTTFTNCNFEEVYTESDERGVFVDPKVADKGVVVEMNGCKVVKADGSESDKTITAVVNKDEMGDTTAVIAINATKNESGYISGTFVGSESAITAKLAEGFELKQNDDGTYGVTEKASDVAFIGGQGYETLDEAIKAVKDGETIIVNAGEYKLNGSLTYSGKAFTIEAAEGAEVSFDMSAAVALHGAKITFNNVTFDYKKKTDNNYIGIQHADTLIYNGCTINGKVFLYAHSETFNDCQFVQTTVDYNVWTYGAKNVAFNGCTFNCIGKAVLVYKEGDDKTFTTVVTVNNTTFKASAKAEGKAAIEIDTSLIGGATIIIDKATSATGFDTGSNSGSSLWHDKKQTVETNKNTTVIVGGETVFEPNFVAQVGEIKYISIAEAIGAANASDTVKLLKDVTEDVTITKDITLNLGGKKLTGTGTAKTATLTIASGATATVMNGTVLGTDNAYYTIQNNGTATFEDLTATAGNTGSSMLDNYGTLTITSGEYTGGMDTIKSEEDSVLTINGGTFTLNDWVGPYTAVVLNYGMATITGGTFIQNADGSYCTAQNVTTGYTEGHPSKTTVTGGTFINNSTKSTAKNFHLYGKAKYENIAISGGQFNKSVADGYFKEGYICVGNTSEGFTAEGPYEAKINSTGYETLEEAVAAANDKSGNVSITLLQNVTVEETLTISKKATLDLNGKTLAGEQAKPVIAVKGTLTIKDGKAKGLAVDTDKNVTYTSGKILAVGGRAVEVDTGATFTMSSGTLESTKNYSLRVVGDGATATINGGYLVGAEGAIGVFGSATLNVKGGVMEGRDNAAIAGNGSGTDNKEGIDYSGTTINVSGGTIIGKISSQGYSACGIYHPQNGTLNVSGGKIYAVNGAGILARAGIVNVTGGNIVSTGNGIGKVGDSRVVVPCSAIVFDIKADYPERKDDAKIAVSGGTFTSDEGIATVTNVGEEGVCIEVAGGTFSSPVSEELCATGYIPQDNGDGTYGVKEGSYVAAIGGTKYESLAEALDKAEAEQIVELIANVDFTSNGSYEITKNLTLDLNGHELKLSNREKEGNFLITNATFTLMDSKDANKDGTGGGKIYTETVYAGAATTKTLIQAGNNGHFIMESGLIDAASFATDPENQGQFAVGVYNNKSKTEASATINGGHVKAGWYAIAGNGQTGNGVGNITVNGGIVESTADYAIYHPQNGTTTINGGVISGAQGGVALKRGELIVNDGLITSKGVGSTGNWGDGTGRLGAAAINVDASYGDATATIKGGTITAEKDALTLDANAVNKATIAVSGGTFSSEVKPEYCADGYEPARKEDGTYGVQRIKVAKINNDYYDSLQEAFNAAANDQGTAEITIALLHDVTVTKTLTFNKNSDTRVILKLKSMSITGDGCRALQIVNGHLKIEGAEDSSLKNGTITSTGIKIGSSVIRVGAENVASDSKQILELANVTVKTDCSYGITVFGDGRETLRVMKSDIISNAEDVGSSYDGCAISTLGSDTTAANVTIMDGVYIEAKNTNAIYMPSGTLLVFGYSTIKGATGIYAKAGNVTIKGAYVYGTGEAKNYNYNGNGGVPTGDALVLDSCGYPAGTLNVVFGDTKDPYTNAPYFESTNAKPIGSYAYGSGTRVTGFVDKGTFNKSIDADLLKDGYICKYDAEKKLYGVDTVANCEAKIGNVYYATLADAIAAAQDGNTVTLVKNFTTDATKTGLADRLIVNKTITLDLNGKTMTIPGSLEDSNNWAAFYITGGTLTVKDSSSDGSGKIIGADKTAENPKYAGGVFLFDVSSGAALTIESGEYYGGGTIVQVTEGTATINGGSFSVYPDVGTKDSRYVLNCIDKNYKNGTAKIIVNGGTFKEFDPRNNLAEGTGTDFVAPGVGVDYNKDGSFTAKSGMIAQIVSANGESVKAYATLSEALDAVNADETVKLITDVSNGGAVSVMAGTLDLNGKNLTVDGAVVWPAAAIIDSAQGVGKLTTTRSMFYIANETNANYLPVKDSDGSYRLFEYELKTHERGAYKSTENGNVIFPFQLTFTSDAALAMLKSSNDNGGLDMQIEVTWDGLENPHLFGFAYNVFAKAEGNTHYLWLQVSRFGADLTGKQVNAKLHLSAAGVKNTTGVVSWNVE